MRKFDQYKIINGKKLPEGWSGKVWALKQGVDSVQKKKILSFNIFRRRHNS